MTDKELVLELCKRLGLKRAEHDRETPDDHEYIDGIEGIRIGTGGGYNGFYATFTFDADGKLTGHGIWE